MTAITEMRYLVPWDESTLWLERVGFNKIDRYKEKDRVLLQSETLHVMYLWGPYRVQPGVSVCFVWDSVGATSAVANYTLN